LSRLLSDKETPTARPPTQQSWAIGWTFKGGSLPDSWFSRNYAKFTHNIFHCYFKKL
jgi:hypothetical protein